MTDSKQVFPFRFDLLPTPKPIKPVAVGELVRPYTEAEIEAFRAKALELEPHRLTKTGQVRKRIKSEVAEPWAELVTVSQIWGDYKQANYRLQDIAKMLRNREMQIKALRDCQQKFHWLKPGMRFNVTDKIKPERPARYIFQGWGVSTGYGIPGENIVTFADCLVLSYKTETWKPSRIHCEWLAKDTLTNIEPVVDAQLSAAA